MFMEMLVWSSIGVVVGLIVHSVDYKGSLKGFYITIFASVAGAVLGGLTAMYIFNDGPWSILAMTLAAFGSLFISVLHRIIFDQDFEEEESMMQGAYYQQIASPVASFKTRDRIDDSV